MKSVSKCINTSIAVWEPLVTVGNTGIRYTIQYWSHMTQRNRLFPFHEKPPEDFLSFPCPACHDHTLASPSVESILFPGATKSIIGETRYGGAPPFPIDSSKQSPFLDP